METKNSVMIGLSAIICMLGTSARQVLKLGFYNTTCPQAKGIVLDVAQKHISLVPELAAALIRMHFHDCFVRGCDGSVLLNSTNGTAKKDAIPNLSLRGFSLIDKAKAAIEKQCPGVVSCADILPLIARDAHLVVLSASFASKGLNNKDLVLLSGAHTIGIAHCGPSFSNRLYNFSGKGDSDPSVDKNYIANLKKNN